MLSEKTSMEILRKMVHAETESEIDEILESYDVFYNDANWRNYGDLPNNFGTIGNQQSDATSALVEKLINSIDAILIKEAKLRGIDPEGQEAPQDMKKAVEEFFAVENGNINTLPHKERRKLADNVNLIATGQKTSPCYVIYDKGEGQEPSKFPETFLSLHSNNKNKIPFVQGRFNMGAGGALPFCGTKNYQLLVSKKHPKLANENEKEYWGFTLVRRRQPREGEKSSVYEYFAPNQEVPKFRAKGLDILPSTETGEYNQVIDYGTFIKLYEYDIKYKSVATIDLYKSLNNKMFEVALPIRMIENRDYKGHTKESTLVGMVARIDNQRQKLEEEFPFSTTINIDKLGKAKVRMWLFKDGIDTTNWYNPSDAVALTINGQTHDSFDKRFFIRKNVGQKSWIKDSLLVQVDCTDFTSYAKENLFMGSRDRIRQGNELSSKLEKTLEDLIREDRALIKWNKKRHEEKMKKVLLQDKVHTQDLFKQMVNDNPEIASLFRFNGQASVSPIKPIIQTNVYTGKEFPTHFDLVSPQDGVKECPVNSFVRISFKTDAVNDFFDRDIEPGRLTIIPEDLITTQRLQNGTLTLIAQPERMGLSIGDEIDIKVICDSEKTPKFSYVIHLTVVDPIEKKEPQKTAQVKRNKNKSDQNIKSPDIQLIGRTEWESIIGKWSEEDVLDIKEDDENIVIFINKDNVHLSRALSREKNEMFLSLLKEQFKYSVGIIGFAIYGNLTDSGDKEKLTYQASQSVAQVILPLINWFIDNSEKLKSA